SAAGRWLRRNLFRGPFDSVVSVVGSAVALYVVYRALRFVFVTGRWDLVRVNLKLLLVGRYPDTHVPRVAVSLVVAAGVAALVAGMVHRRQQDAGTDVKAAMSLGRRLVDLADRLWPVLVGAGLLLALSSSPGP